MKFSIITPSFNQVRFLRQTMQSILSQEGDFELQWIVMDGGSTDGSVELLMQSARSDPRIVWTSEKDAGQSDAINKGLSKADGQVIGWLNSDDLYAPRTLAAVADAFQQHPDAQWLAGRCGIIDQEGGRIRESITSYKNRLLERCTHRRLLGGENPISQPAVFWRRAFGQRVGPLDVTLHHAMDYDFWLRMSRISEPLILRRELSLFRIHATSKSGTQTAERFAEQYAVAGRYFAGDRTARAWHWFNRRKIVWGYRVVGWREKTNKRRSAKC
jgi:glycosyltransferase involved in cell wall biosynthesis